MANRVTVVVSQGQSENPKKRKMEQDLVAALQPEADIDVTVIVHLYDLTRDSLGVQALQPISGDMIVLSWLFPRAAHWILDRNGIRGQFGETLLKPDDDDDEDDVDGREDEAEFAAKQRVTDLREVISRKIFCIDFRDAEGVQPFVDEIKRIAAEQTAEVVPLADWVQGSPKPEQMQRFLQPLNDTSPGGHHAAGGNGASVGRAGSQAEGGNASVVARIDENAERRWYPVIDFNRCTNCMECIDFCLFGVYGVDQAETILVEQPDNCRKGCPACSRVCPENAIIFPQHKTPAIAGSPEFAGGLKIDLSQLFGAPEGDKSAIEVAALERDEQLVLAGREAVGLTVGIAKRQDGKKKGPGDDLDQLIDQLDDMDI